jgi:Flp pilus assembly protein TadD
MIRRDAASALKTLEPLAMSDDAGIQVTLAQAYLQLRRYGEAIASLEKSHVAESNDLFKRQLALSFLKYGDTNTAVQHLQKLAARDPDNWQIAAPLLDALIQ